MTRRQAVSTTGQLLCFWTGATDLDVSPSVPLTDPPDKPGVDMVCMHTMHDHRNLGVLIMDSNHLYACMVAASAKL